MEPFCVEAMEVVDSVAAGEGPGLRWGSASVLLLSTSTAILVEFSFSQVRAGANTES